MQFLPLSLLSPADWSGDDAGAAGAPAGVGVEAGLSCDGCLEVEPMATLSGGEGSVAGAFAAMQMMPTARIIPANVLNVNMRMMKNYTPVCRGMRQPLYTVMR